MADTEFDTRAACEGLEDEDAALLARRSWFARQLGDEWQEREPGIYDFVGAVTPGGRDSGFRLSPGSDKALPSQYALDR